MIPLADAAALRGPARRTAALGLVLFGATATCVAFALLLSERSLPAPAAAAATGSNVEVVLDLSGSVSGISSPQMLAALRGVAATTERVGVVAFSDSAEVVLPPESPASELRKLYRFFEPVHGHVYGQTPWSLQFTAGTSISTGIAEARRALERIGGGGSVVLVSDAGDAITDLPALRRELLALAREGDGFRLDLVQGSIPVDLKLYRAVFGRGAIRPAARPEPRAAPARREAGFPIWPTAIAGIVALLLGARELTSVSLRWRPA